MTDAADYDADRALLEEMALDERIDQAREAVSQGTPHEWQRRLARKLLSHETN